VDRQIGNSTQANNLFRFVGRSRDKLYAHEKLYTEKYNRNFLIRNLKGNNAFDTRTSKKQKQRPTGPLLVRGHVASRTAVFNRLRHPVTESRQGSYRAINFCNAPNHACCYCRSRFFGTEALLVDVARNQLTMSVLATTANSFTP